MGFAGSLPVEGGRESELVMVVAAVLVVMTEAVANEGGGGEGVGVGEDVAVEMFVINIEPEYKPLWIGVKTALDMTTAPSEAGA